MDENNFCTWDIRAWNDEEAKEKCEHLKECCVKNGGWTPVKEEIILNEITIVYC
jgi:hypothetical protein